MDYVENDVAALRALIDESPTPIGLYTGSHMQIHLANKAMIAAWGKDEQVIGKLLKDALPELEGQPFHNLLHEVYTTGKPYEATEDLVKIVINGELRDFYFDFTYKPLFNASGKVWGILNTATDVTELVLTRKRAAETQEQLNFSLRAAQIGTWDLDIVNQVVNWDYRTRELFGFTQSEAIAYTDVLKYMHPHDRPIVDAAVAHALSGEADGNYDVKFRTVGAQGNELKWLHCRGKAYFDTDGKPTRFSGIAQDITTEVTATEKMLSAEQLAQLALENIGAGSYYVGIDSNEFVYTPLLSKILTGIDNLNLSRDAFVEYLHPDDAIIRETAYKNAIATGHLTYEARFIWADGSIHWIRVLGRYAYDENANPINFAGIVQDISNETDAKNEQQKLLWLIDNSTDFISLTNWDGHLTYINQAGLNLMDFTSLEDAQLNYNQYVIPEEAEKIRHIVDPTLLREGRWTGELKFKNHQTGHVIPGLATTLLLRDSATGHPLGKASVIRDLRPELEARQALTQSEELFRGITTASPAALWMTNTQGGITYVNQIWINWTGLPLEHHLDAGWLNVVLAQDIENASGQFVKDFTDRRFHESQFRIRHTDGTIRWVVCTGNPQYNINGNFTGYIGACVDITEQKNLQNQKDEFIGIASHELKTPVTSIKAYAQVLQATFTREGDERKALMLSKMNSQIDRLTALIGDLLDVTKIQSGRLQFNDDYFDFNQLVTEISEDLQRTTNRHLIETELQPLPQVYADKYRITQVLSNLVTNAIKYSPTAQKVVITTSLTAENEVMLCVQDFGIGISPDKQEKVFEQFYRVSGDNQYTFPGLGLGLYITSEIIKRAGGRIWVNSAVGQGSTFCCAIPVKQ